MKDSNEGSMTYVCSRQGRVPQIQDTFTASLLMQFLSLNTKASVFLERESSLNLNRTLENSQKKKKKHDKSINFLQLKRKNLTVGNYGLSRKLTTNNIKLNKKKKRCKNSSNHQNPKLTYQEIFETHRKRKEVALISLRIRIRRSHGGGWEASPETEGIRLTLIGESNIPGGKSKIYGGRRCLKERCRDGSGERKRCIFEEII